MPLDRLTGALRRELAALTEQGTRKGDEDVVVGVVPGGGLDGPRLRLKGYLDKHFLRMNSNGYLGMPLREELMQAEEMASRYYGVGPGAVRFISGTYEPHVKLEARLAAFHGRDAGMIFSSAYATVVATLSPFLDANTVVISDELNHNCIINAVRLARPGAKKIYKHLDMGELKARLADAAGSFRRAVVVTDGIFSMRGDHAPLDEISEIVSSFDEKFEENAVLVVDDSHGVGAFGATGRGTEEVTGARCDILVATLGKALGVNGGYVVSDAPVIEWLREKATMYIYSNPITCGEAAAAQKAVDILDSGEGKGLLKHLRAMTARFKEGIVALGYETLPGEHPIVPLMVRDTQRTSDLVAHLKESCILVTGLNYPVVPKGDESIRFQISAEHTEADIDYAIEVLRKAVR
jgi:glycine C-acetyltransferase